MKKTKIIRNGTTKNCFYVLTKNELKHVQKRASICHRGYLVDLRFREISIKREEQNKRGDHGHAHAAIWHSIDDVIAYYYFRLSNKMEHP